MRITFLSVPTVAMQTFMALIVIVSPLNLLAGASLSDSTHGVLYWDANGNGTRDRFLGFLMPLEAGIGGVSMTVFAEQNLHTPVTTLHTDEANNVGSFDLSTLSQGNGYWIEWWQPMPLPAGTNYTDTVVAQAMVDDNGTFEVRQIEPFHHAVQLRRYVVIGKDTLALAVDPNVQTLTQESTFSSEGDGAEGLLLPDLLTISGELWATHAELAKENPGPEEYSLDSTSQPGRRLLRFGTAALNKGRGPLHVLAGVVTDDQQMIYQRIYRADGSFIDRPAGRFTYHPGHAHIHADAFESYRLRLRHGATLLQEVTGNKVGFCLTDVLPILLQQFSTAPVRIRQLGWQCGMREQGINVGWADYYGPKLDDQWIDVTNLPSGTYELEITVDPDGYLWDSDRSNNTLILQVNF